MNDLLIKQADIQKIATEGDSIYQAVKSQYDPEHKGKFLAVDIDSKDVFLGNSSAEALQLAKKTYPDKVFYMIKIGYDVAETMARSFINT